MMEVSAFEMRLWREELFPGKAWAGGTLERTGTGRSNGRFLYIR